MKLQATEDEKGKEQHPERATERRLLSLCRTAIWKKINRKGRASNATAAMKTPPPARDGLTLSCLTL